MLKHVENPIRPWILGRVLRSPATTFGHTTAHSTYWPRRRRVVFVWTCLYQVEIVHTIPCISHVKIAGILRSPVSYVAVMERSSPLSNRRTPRTQSEIVESYEQLSAIIQTCFVDLRAIANALFLYFFPLFSIDQWAHTPSSQFSSINCYFFHFANIQTFKLLQSSIFKHVHCTRADTPDSMSWQWTNANALCQLLGQRVSVYRWQMGLWWWPMLTFWPIMQMIVHLFLSFSRPLGSMNFR